MKTKSQSSIEVETIISRTFRACAEEVWQAWTEPEYLKLWWGPNGITVPFYSIDLKTGGKYLYCLQSPDGENIWGTGIFREIVPLRLIRTSDSFSDQYGNVVPSSFYGMNADFPLIMKLTVSFHEYDDITEIILKYSLLPGGKAAESTETAWNESLNKLSCLLKNKAKFISKNILVPDY